MAEGDHSGGVMMSKAKRSTIGMSGSVTRITPFDAHVLATGGRSVDNPLVQVVQFLPPQAKVAMYNVANTETLKRRTWRGCPLNRAGCALGSAVVNERDAMLLFNVPRHAVRRFILAWDCLRGTDDQCTDLLRDAIRTVGLYTEPELVKRSRWSFRWRMQPVVVAHAPVAEDAALATVAEAPEAADTDARVPVGAGV
jgi:hypothetical protein